MLPEPFLEKMRTLLGAEFTTFLESYDNPPLHSLRFNPLKGSAAAPLRAALQSQWHLQPVPWAPTGFYYEENDTLRPGKHPYHEAGLYYIQEASAMAPAEYLDPQPGDYVLDLCAAPGGKSTQIAGKLQGEGLLVCNEIVPNRAKILSENLERMGIRNALVTNMSPDDLAPHFPRFFDRIMVDAPCSGEGMFRKRDNAVEEWSPENVALCANRQDWILEYAAQMLAPGGRMVYSTCTFSPEENEGTVTRFLKAHPEFSLVKIKKTPEMADGQPAWYEDAPAEVSRTLRFFPHRIAGEGHFLAVLEHMGTPTPRESRLTTRQLEPGILLSSLPECEAFLQDSLRDFLVTTENRSFLLFGEQVYLLPVGTPRLKGLKVLRPGLHLGTMRKNRFEPAHALALALTPDDVFRSVSLIADAAISSIKNPATDLTAAGYISGQTFPYAGDKGWYLICADGISLGWGKCAGNMMKNHYPKGLRKNL